MGKKWLSEITDRFTDETVRNIKGWELEGKLPWNAAIPIEHGYRITIHGQVIWQNNKPLTLIPRKWKRSRIVIMTLNKKNANWDRNIKKKEERIDNLMKKYFWPHIEWYSEMKLHRNQTYIVVPKDGNWNDMSVSNLKYTLEETYNLNWTKKSLLIPLIPFFKNKSEEELAKLLSTSRWWVNRIKSELKAKGEIWDEVLNKLVISHKSYQIYIALLACDWLQSNLDIAKKLRPQADFTDKGKQDSLTDKVSRVRRKLYDKKLIKKYNTYQKEINIWDVRQELKKMLIANKAIEKSKRKTHAEIAEIFGLWKEQVDNYSRQIAKKRKE
jgi:hypothetical protein